MCSEVGWDKRERNQSMMMDEWLQPKVLTYSRTSANDCKYGCPGSGLRYAAYAT